MPYGSVHFTADRGSYPHETPFFGAPDPAIPDERRSLSTDKPASGNQIGGKRGWRSSARSTASRVGISRPCIAKIDLRSSTSWSSDLLIVKVARCCGTDAKVASSMILALRCGIRSHSDSGIFSSFVCRLSRNFRMGQPAVALGMGQNSANRMDSFLPKCRHSLTCTQP